MIKSYCSKCKQASTGDTCQYCGKRLPVSTQQDVWSVDMVPLSDGRIWRSILLTLVGVVALLFVLIFGLEAIIAGNHRVQAMWQGGVPQLILSILPIGLLIAFAALSLQGRETQLFVLDKNGAHLQTWHAPGRLKSWARLQSYDRQRDFYLEDGSVQHLAQEWHFLWRDVQRVEPRPHRACILLYYTPRCAPMVLRLPPDEYEQAAEWIKRHCKGK